MREGTAATPRACPRGSLPRENARNRLLCPPRAAPSGAKRRAAARRRKEFPRAPQGQQRAFDLAARLHVGVVDLDVGRLSGAVVLAGRVQALRLREECAIVIERTRVEDRIRLPRHSRRASSIRDIRSAPFRSASPATDRVARETSSERLSWRAAHSFESHISQVGTMSSVDKRVTRFGWSSASR